MGGGAEPEPLYELKPPLWTNEQWARYKLYTDVRAWDPEAYEIRDSRLNPEKAAAAVEAALTNGAALRELTLWRDAQLQKFDDEIARLRDPESWDSLTDAWLNELKARELESAQQAWDKANPVGLTPSEREELIAKIRKGEEAWGEHGEFKVGRFTVQMDVTNIVSHGTIGPTTTNESTSVGRSDTAGTSDSVAETKNRGGKISITPPGDTGGLGGELDRTSSTTKTHTDSRDHSDERGRNSSTQVEGRGEKQEVTVKATIKLPGSDTGPTVDLGRVKVIHQE